MTYTDPVEMSSTVSLAWSVFLGGVLGGWYLYDLYAKHKSLEQAVLDASGHVNQLDLLYRDQSDLLCEHDQRIREKDDYDPDQEIEPELYQAWRGTTLAGEQPSIAITIWREKLSTVAKNRDWKSWEGESDGSCVVRDFYIGNLNPDFQWTVLEAEGVLCGSVRETMVNGWDSVVKMKIDVICDSDNMPERSSLAFNHSLKEVLEQKRIIWSKELIHSPVVW